MLLVQIYVQGQGSFPLNRIVDENISIEVLYIEMPLVSEELSKMPIIDVQIEW
jgi:hypothetical protein